MSYVGAPYNFVPLGSRVYRKDSITKHNEITGLSGSLEYQVTAQTPILVDGGDEHFYKNKDGKAAIPGSTMRGLVRSNMQILSQSSIVDDIGNAKLMYCKEQDIPAVISVDKNIRGLTQTELCCVLGNLLDNAIEAELKLSKAQRKIEIKIVMIEEVLDILIRNRIAESVLQDVQKVKNIGTTKQDAENHGFGLKSVREIVKKYDGFMDLYEDSGCFCVHIRI